MDITVTQTQARVPVTILRVQGKFDGETDKQFDEVAWPAIMKGGTHDMLIDLSEVPYMSSAGLRSLNSVYKLLHSPEERNAAAPSSGAKYKSPHLKLVNPPERVMQTLIMGGFDSFLDIYPTEQEALAAF